MNPEIESILREPSTTRTSNHEMKKRLLGESGEEKKKNSSLFVLSPGVEDEDGAVRLRKRIPAEGTK